MPNFALAYAVHYIQESEKYMNNFLAYFFDIQPILKPRVFTFQSRANIEPFELFYSLNSIMINKILDDLK